MILETIQDRMDAGDVLVIDGGMGTELERRGVPMDAQSWAGSALKTHPDLIRTIHRDFIDAGADLLIANSYAAAPHVLSHAGFSEAEALALNRLACELVREAVAEAAPDRRIWIAGSLSSFYAGLSAWPSMDEARRSYALQAETLVAAGCDLLVTEMMLDNTVSPLAVGAASATGLPVWAGFSVRTANDRVLGLNERTDLAFERIRDDCLGAGDVHAAGIMHSEMSDTPPGLDQLKEAWAGPLFAYPHSGSFRMPNWQFDDEIEPDAFAREAASYLDRGVTAIGGCCGMSPHHIAALARHLGRDGRS